MIDDTEQLTSEVNSGHKTRAVTSGRTPTSVYVYFRPPSSVVHLLTYNVTWLTDVIWDNFLFQKYELILSIHAIDFLHFYI